MQKFFSEARLCFKNDSSKMQGSDPQWTFGDLPIDAKFQFDDGIRDGDTQYRKDGIREASVRIDRTRTGMNSPSPLTRIKNPVIPTVDEIRERFTAAMREPNAHLPPPQALLLAFERESLADAERARQAVEFGGVPYGPTKNPSDQLREVVEWSTVPAGSFFCIPENPHEAANVYLRISGDYVMKICSFKQWVQGLKGVSIPNKNVKLSEVLNYSPRRMSELKVTVLYAETPDEFERMLVNAKAKRDASPKSNANDAYHEELRQTLAAFWAGVEQRRAERQEQVRLQTPEPEVVVSPADTGATEEPKPAQEVAPPLVVEQQIPAPVASAPEPDTPKTNWFSALLNRLRRQ